MSWPYILLPVHPPTVLPTYHPQTICPKTPPSHRHLTPRHLCQPGKARANLLSTGFALLWECQCMNVCQPPSSYVSAKVLYGTCTTTTWHKGLESAQGTFWIAHCLCYLCLSLLIV